IPAVGRARSISIFAISHRDVPGPVRISVRYKGPGVCSQVENRTAVATPALLMERYFQPGSASTARNVMNADHLSRCRRRPIWIALWNSIDLVVVNVNELRDGGTGWINAKDLSERVLYS